MDGPEWTTAVTCVTGFVWQKNALRCPATERREDSRLQAQEMANLALRKTTLFITLPLTFFGVEYSEQVSKRSASDAEAHKKRMRQKVNVHFPLSVEKAIQAIGVLFRSHSAPRMNYMRVLKLLYIADREALRETGRPITGGPAIAMERGPVLEEVYDLIRGQHREMPLWDEYFQKDHYELVLRKDPDVGRLSRYEIRILQEVAKARADDDEWELSKLTHEFAEWQQNDPGKSSRAIPLGDMLKAVGQGEASATILEEAREKARIERLFGR